jgi:type II secretory pathway pseudopilin PulG
MKKGALLQRRLAAFTIAELLIAVAITSLIVVMLAQVFSAAAAMWQTSDQRIDAFRDARSAMQLMAVDLGRANINGDAKMLTLAQYSTDGSYATEADAITPIKNSGKSDLCTVEYYLSWNGTTKTFALMRRVKNSDTTTGLLATAAPNFNTIYDKNNTNSREEILATPVWALEFRPGELDTVLAPSTDSAAKWKWIEIRFKTMSVNSARKLKSMAGIAQATWSDPTTTTYKTLILPYEQQFVTRITLSQNQ